MSLTSLDFTLARGKIRSQREAFKSVRGSNEGGCGDPRDPLFGFLVSQAISPEGSGNATWVAPAAQHAASRTG